MKTPEELFANICRNSRPSTVTEALLIIEQATEYGFSQCEVDEAFQYLIDHHALAIVPAWVARAATAFIQSGDCHE